MARVTRCAGLSLLLFIYLSAAPYRLALPEPTRAPHATRQELVGAWRLVSIQIMGPSGPMTDPFYNADPTGILVYDASGWMSVQIVGQPRPPMEAAASRPARNETVEDAKLKAAVLDSYYAYFGTWDYDEAASKVTHHIKSSLISGETGMSYSQTVAREGTDLIFTTRREVAGVATVQRKVWRRITGPKS
jgi:Lipocalin-like domain